MSRDAVPSLTTGRTASGVTRGVGRTLTVVGFAALTAVGARLSVPLPGVSVPMTLQPVAVLLAGFLLGSRAGAASQILYLAIGAAGVPVFAAGGGAAYLLGPTGGYLLAFPVAAAVAGLAHARSRGVLGVIVCLFLGLALLHAGGLSWLWISGGREAVAAVGLQPFLLGDALKVLLVAIVGRGVQRARRSPRI